MQRSARQHGRSPMLISALDKKRSSWLRGMVGISGRGTETSLIREDTSWRKRWLVASRDNYKPKDLHLSIDPLAHKGFEYGGRRRTMGCNRV